MNSIVLGSVNGDTSSMSECSAVKVVESNAVCILTAIDSKLTDHDREGECIVHNVYASVCACVDVFEFSIFVFESWMCCEMEERVVVLFVEMYCLLLLNNHLLFLCDSVRFNFYAYLLIIEYFQECRCQ